MRPLQSSSLPTRSKDIDLLCQYGAACERRAKKQLVLVDSPPHRRSGKAGFTIEIEVDGGADCLVIAGKRLMLGQRDVNGPQQKLEDGPRVVAEALVARARVATRHRGHDQRLQPQGQSCVSGLEGGHAAVAQNAV